MNFRKLICIQRARHLGLGLLLALQVVITASCSLSTPYPSRSLYTINAGAVEPSTLPAPAPPKAITLRVRRLVAIPPFESQSFVYRVATNSIKTDYYDTFAAPPADLVTSQLIQWLRASHLFTSITDAGGGVPHQWVLEGRLQNLSIDLSDSTKAEAVMVLQVVVMDESGAETRILLDHLYKERVQITATDADSAAAGWSTACRKIFERIAGDLSAIPVHAGE